MQQGCIQHKVCRGRAVKSYRYGAYIALAVNGRGNDICRARTECGNVSVGLNTYHGLIVGCPHNGSVRRVQRRHFCAERECFADAERQS